MMSNLRKDKFIVNGEEEYLSGEDNNSTEMIRRSLTSNKINNYDVMRFRTSHEILDPLFGYLDYKGMSRISMLSRYWNLKVRNDTRILIEHNYAGTYLEICDRYHFLDLVKKLHEMPDDYIREVENYQACGYHHYPQLHASCTFSSLLYLIPETIYYSDYRTIFLGNDRLGLAGFIFGYCGLPGTIVSTFCGVFSACQTGMLLFKCANQIRLDRQSNAIKNEIRELESKIKII